MITGHPLCCRQADLTDQFYARYAREYVVRHGLKQQWEELLNLPEDQQHMEKGIIHWHEKWWRRRGGGREERT